MMMKAPDIYMAVKSASGLCSWVERENQELTLVLPLDIGGVTIERLLLRAKTYKDRPNEDVMFQLECVHDPARSDYAIERIDWRPMHKHNNQGKGPQHLKHKLQIGTHRHRFDLNWLEEEGRLLKDNLPLAEPINSDPASYEELVDFAKDCFRISALEIPAPPWEAKLL